MAKKNKNEEMPVTAEETMTKETPAGNETMTAEEELPAGEVPEELLTAETGQGAGAPGGPVGSFMEHTVDELPALVNYSEGDEVKFRVSKISDDGKTYTLEAIASTPEAPASPMV